MNDNGSTLYDRLKAAGCEMASYNGDLYVPRNDSTLAIIKAFEAEGGKSNKSTFVNQVSRTVWIELPFAHDPFWRKHPQPAPDAGEQSVPTP